MEINVLDYLTKEEIKDICKDEIRQKINRSFKEEDMARIVSNSAYYKYYDLVDEHITDEHRKIIVGKVEQQINEDKLDIFRYNWQSNRPESEAARIVESVIVQNKSVMIKRVNEMIEKFLNDDQKNYEMLIEKIQDNLWNGFSIKFDKKEMI